MIGNASQHLPKFFHLSIAAAISPNFLPPKFFYFMITEVFNDSDISCITKSSGFSWFLNSIHVPAYVNL